jgi:hypothetical protein
MHGRTPSAQTNTVVGQQDRLEGASRRVCQFIQTAPKQRPVALAQTYAQLLKRGRNNDLLVQFPDYAAWLVAECPCSPLETRGV